MAAVTIVDAPNTSRNHEPVHFTVPGELDGDLWIAVTDSGEEVLCQRLGAPDASTPGTTSFVATVSFTESVTLTLVRPGAPEGVIGMVELDGVEKDSFVRLDTGYFDLELCSGTAEGTGNSKWGIRHFRLTSDGIDLLPSGNNAIGGFYGPFFTPENGLINPPEHTTVDIEVLEDGPVLKHYRMHGVVPDGLLPELRGKAFSIDWWFTYGTPYFRRQYTVDDFQTEINGRSVTNKITVGDEFESGQGELLFNRFAAHGGTRYRAGDPYAGVLADMVEETLATSPAESERFRTFKEALTGDLASAHWDLYWRLFCAWEKALPENEIRERLTRVRETSHVLADLPERSWVITDEPVDVSGTEHETIFSGPASKSAEYDTGTGRCMVWWTSQPSGAFQIVQRRQSGWVNWGSNGENECPELPVGVQIKTAFGYFDDWQRVADGLESAPKVGPAES
ncbi:hypothetical protein [Knoellia koreensis]|uniref:Uncharacterized protein n=1 Tax=Knoellia koreensis TaxID=2730921 RepID=A0A849HHZ5_9MICO|nr:hypothetical protein [Knoellia sp. DB2414S]NNM46822.1 hypothetical protein [Knoellia sp. DB2414S]